MRTYRNMSPLPTPEKPRGDARRRGRVRTDTLACSLGEVIDLSAGGLRVRCPARNPPAIGDTCTIAFNHELARLSVKARVRWFQRVGWSAIIVGLEFFDLAEHDRAAISELMLTGMDQRWLARE